MIMATRCWFVPESRGDTGFIPTVERLEEILVADQVDEATRRHWLDLAVPLLAAPIKEGSVWVDRRARYDAAATDLALCPEAVDDVLFANALFDRATFFTFDAKRTNECGPAARAWFSKRLGSGDGANFPVLAKLYTRLADVVASVGLDPQALAGGMEQPIEELIGTLCAHGHRSYIRVSGFAGWPPIGQGKVHSGRTSEKVVGRRRAKS